MILKVLSDKGKNASALFINDIKAIGFKSGYREESWIVEVVISNLHDTLTIAVFDSLEDAKKCYEDCLAQIEDYYRE